MKKSNVRVCLSVCFILADMHACVFIHNAAAAVAACSSAFFYIRKVFGVFLKLFHSEEIHQVGRGKTTEEQRSIESVVHIRGNNGCWIIESFLSHQLFVPGLMGFFSKRQHEREGKEFSLFFEVKKKKKKTWKEPPASACLKILEWLLLWIWVITMFEWINFDCIIYSEKQ